MLDSGLGGLSVFREIEKQIPQEQVVYFGDTAHVPYGEKTNEQIMDYVFSIIDFLVQKDVKMVIIACNTATAIALDEARKKYSLPIIGVIQPGANEVTSRTQNRRIGIIGTEVTIRNQSYEKLIKKINPSIATFSHPCSNQIIREMEKRGLGNEQLIRNLLKEGLKPIINNDVDTLVLGCTHYPFLKKFIQELTELEMCLVDPAKATVEQAKKILKENQLMNTHKNKTNSFFISGDSDLFAKIAEKLLGYYPGDFHRVTL